MGRDARDGPPRPAAPNLMTLLGIGVMFGVCIGVGVFGGVLLDDALGTSPLLALLGVAVGILVGATGAYQVIRPYTRSSRSEQSGLKRSTKAPGTGDSVQLASAEPDDDVRSDEK